MGNRGWKRGFSQVASPRAAENFNSPTSAFRPVFCSGANLANFQANSWDAVLVTTNNIPNIVLPADAQIGDQVRVVAMGTLNAVQFLVIVAPPGQTIGGFTSLQMNGGLLSHFYYNVTLEYMQPNLWVPVAMVQVDMSMGFEVSGGLHTTNGAISLGSGSGTATSGCAVVTAPTLGVAAKVNTSFDTMVYIQVTTTGQLTVAIGPTSGVANTILNATSAVAGQLITVRVPNNWFIAVTTSSTAVWTATAIIC